MSTVFTPATLAERWSCSERHIRNMVNRGELRAFRVGGKLLRIPLDAVEDFEACRTTPSDDTGEGSPSSTTAMASDTATASAPLTRARLNTVRRGYTPN